MLEVTPDQGTHPDVFRKAEDPRADAAHGPDNQVDLRACLRGCVQSVDDFPVHEVVQFPDDATVRPV